MAITLSRCKSAQQNDTPDYSPQSIDAKLIERVAKWPAPPKPRELRDASEGLILRHQPSGYLGLYVELGRGKRERLCNAADIIDKMKPLTFSQARRKARVLRGRSEGGEDFKAGRRAAKAIPTFAEFLNETYAPWFRANRRSGAENIARIETCFSKTFAATKLDQITPDRLDAWRARHMQNVKPETANRDTTRIKAALSRAAKWKIIPTNPLAGYEYAQVDRNKRALRALTEDEDRALREALARRDATIAEGRANGNAWRKKRSYAPLPTLDGQYADALTPAVLVSLETGLRRGELFALGWDRVDLEGAMLHVEGETTKSYESREIPLNAIALAVLRKWKMQNGRPERGLVFSGMRGKLTNLRKSFAAVLDDAKIERSTGKGRITWHSLRHAFGTRLGARGVDVETMRALLGHADITTTSRYLHTEEARKRAAVEALG